MLFFVFHAAIRGPIQNASFGGQQNGPSLLQIGFQRSESFAKIGPDNFNILNGNINKNTLIYGLQAKSANNKK